ncbi:hypothetical protein [Elizabethkingia anophelis]|nr:hypothetical protein [Elizabethkingia anophelis]
MEYFERDGKTYKKVFTRSIKKNGKTIYHPKGGVFVFEVEVK